MYIPKVLLFIGALAVFAAIYIAPLVGGVIEWLGRAYDERVARPEFERKMKSEFPGHAPRV